MLRRAALLIALSACTQETKLGREIHTPPPAPSPIRVELGECSQSSDEFVSGEAPPTPEYWSAIDQPWPSLGLGEVGVGRYGTIGHGSGIGGGRTSVYGRSTPPPRTLLGQMEVTGIDGEKWKPITRRYIRRSLASISYCYEKQMTATGNEELAGTLVATLNVDKAGRVVTTVTTTFDETVGTCVKGVLDAIVIPTPDAPYTATLPLSFAPATEAQDARRAAAASATAIGAGHPLAGREGEIAACLRTTPAAAGAGVIDWQFGLDGKATTVTLVGPDNECIEKLAATVTNTSRAKNLRCAFVTGDSPPGELVTVGILPDGMLRFEGGPLEVYQLRSRIGNHVKSYSNIWARAVARGPIALSPGPTVAMKIVKTVMQEVWHTGIGTVFVVPHAFGGIRLLGARVPLPMTPVGRTRVDALHVVHVHRIGVDADDVSVASAAELMAALERMRRDGTAVQVRFDMDATFGDFAQVVDMAVDAGLTDWHL